MGKGLNYGDEENSQIIGYSYVDWVYSTVINVLL